MTNPDRDPEHSSPAESGSGGTEPPAGGYEVPAYGQPSDYPPPPPGFDQPGYQQPGYPQPGYQQPGYPPPPPGYPPYGSFGTPYEAPGGYPPPPPGYPPYGGGYSAAPKTNALAIWSLVASLVGFICCIGSVVGIALGLVSLNQIKQSQEEGQGLAIAGIAVGAVSLLASLVMTVVFMNV
ncbi:DUF4190 domain-containing protein [Mycolicibacterium litorale]|uniref:DUF4190 domain-containing protein n=1 Tax=Mycolicibacterium litorale TaxID=758802 RepID=A0AAD1IFU4_9MYCO|nr:DUF4190 domain-containing protein [Mycolicibacterium litorale]MCV7414692.1 DUF4190 domain-containing protein [Mycolicibacterium litorale]TDY00812.1 uncharacterized protein DUF4190 [Mycolicibacterium litorale]BBY14709.1 hypothetical protein MLIT_03010 [Mycolicibacterium litorale]